MLTTSAGKITWSRHKVQECIDEKRASVGLGPYLKTSKKGLLIISTSSKTLKGTRIKPRGSLKADVRREGFDVAMYEFLSGGNEGQELRSMQKRDVSWYMDQLVRILFSHCQDLVQFLAMTQILNEVNNAGGIQLALDYVQAL